MAARLHQQAARQSQPALKPWVRFPLPPLRIENFLTGAGRASQGELEGATVDIGPSDALGRGWEGDSRQPLLRYAFGSLLVEVHREGEAPLG